MTPHVDPLAIAEASGPARRAMLTHLSACALCRSRAVEHDPAILFSLLALTPLPAPLLQDLSTQVARLAGRDRSPLGTLAGAAPWPRRAAVAAVFALTLISGYATLREKPAGPPAISRFERRADVDVTAGRGISQVIDLTVGETQIVMVYNGELKL